MTHKKLPGASFEVTASREHRSVYLDVTGIDGDTYFVPLPLDLAAELGRRLLAGVLAVGGDLLARN